MAKSKKLQAKNVTTFILALIIIVFAIYLYYNKDKLNLDALSENSSSKKSTILQDGATVTGVLKVHFIDVGQGDCMFVELPDGNNMLIDSGKPNNDELITNYIHGLGYEKIDILFATHSDDDHIGSMPEIFANFEIVRCLRPAIYYDGEHVGDFSSDFNVQPDYENLGDIDVKTHATDAYYKFLSALQQEGCHWEYFDYESDFYNSFEHEGENLKYKMDFLSPTKKVPFIAYEDANDYSPISILSYGNFELLLTGDAHKTVETEVLNYYSEYPDVEVLKVGHHGSHSSTADEFIKAFKPEFAVIQCGNHKTYQHPRQVTLTTLYNNGVIPYRTDMQGTIVLTVQSNGSFNFACEKEVLDLESLYVGKDKK